MRPTPPHPAPAAAVRCCITTLALIGCFFPADAQPDLAVMTGYGVSFFGDGLMRELTSTKHGSEVPIGLTAAMPIMGVLHAGIEVRASLIPFTWEYQKSGAPPGEVTVSQNAASALLRLDFGRGSTVPYCRVGLGLYGGAIHIRYDDQSLYPDGNLDFHSSIGVSLAAGARGTLGSDKFWFGEVIFHALRRTLEGEGYPSWRAHNCGIQGGVGRRF